MTWHIRQIYRHFDIMKTNALWAAAVKISQSRSYRKSYQPENIFPPLLKDASAFKCVYLLRSYCSKYLNSFYYFYLLWYSHVWHFQIFNEHKNFLTRWRHFLIAQCLLLSIYGWPGLTESFVVFLETFFFLYFSGFWVGSATLKAVCECPRSR